MPDITDQIIHDRTAIKGIIGVYDTRTSGLTLYHDMAHQHLVLATE
jgi:hypothetical protein